MRYLELTVWKKAMEAAKEVIGWQLLPQEGRTGCAWITRAAVSIPANIAEAGLEESNRSAVSGDRSVVAEVERI